MVDENYTHILAIVDRSGSMAWNSADKEMAAALNNYFREQAAVDGECRVDYVQFDNSYEKVFEDRPAWAAEAVIEPRGSTALVDAVARGTVELGAKLRKLPENKRPGKVQVVVVTDGGENSSREYTADDLRKMVQEQEEKWNWDYVFLGANIDAVATGKLFGFKEGSSITYDINNAAAVDATAQSLSAYSTTYRGGGAAAFSDDDRKKAVSGS